MAYSSVAIGWRIEVVITDHATRVYPSSVSHNTRSNATVTLLKTTHRRLMASILGQPGKATAKHLGF